MSLQRANQFAGASIDLQIEQPNSKTAEKNEKYFTGKLNCYAFTDESIRTEVKHFSVDIKEGKLSIDAPKFEEKFSGASRIHCIGTDITLPANFGDAPSNTILVGTESKLRIRAEYKRDNLSRQFADSSSQSVNLINPPVRTHGNDLAGVPISYLPLAKSVSIESSGTIFEPKAGFKLILKEVQHDIKRLDIDHVVVFEQKGSRFASLAPHNTYYEPSVGPNYVNCTTEILGKASFDTVLIFDADTNTHIEFKTRDPNSHGNWLDIEDSAAGADIAVSCPDLTILNPTELPSVVSIWGTGYKGEAQYDVGKQPHILSISSAAGFASLAVFSAVTIATVSLSMF